MRKILPHFSRNFAKIAKVKNLPYWLLKCGAGQSFIFTFYLHKNSCNLDTIQSFNIPFKKQRLSLVLSLRLDLFLITKSLELENALSHLVAICILLILRFEWFHTYVKRDADQSYAVSFTKFLAITSKFKIFCQNSGVHNFTFSVL